MKLLICGSLLLLIQISLYSTVFERKAEIDRQVRIDFVLPSSFSRIAALDFKGLAADFQFLQAVFFMGEKIGKDEEITPADWNHFKRVIWAVIELDPYFADAYYFSAAFLTWGPQLYDDALAILERGLKYRKDDFRIPYLMGFIHFYFLKDNLNGAKYLKIAADRPGAPKVIYSKLASRLAYYAGDHKFSLMILESILLNENNDAIRKLLSKRIKAVKGAIYLEDEVKHYSKEYGKLPKDINQLVEGGIISKFPEEPYGGKWILLEQGRITTTSRFVEKKIK